VVSFFNTNKYPPSLQFLLMTLGPSLIALAWFDKLAVKDKLGAIGRFFIVFGRVPLFYYILHLFLIHGMAVLVAMAWGQPYQWLLHGGFFLSQAPPGYGHHLPFIYGMWATAVVILYFPCKWYMELKARRKDWWLSYL
jgi:predicted acyltransferase